MFQKKKNTLPLSLNCYSRRSPINVGELKNERSSTIHSASWLLEISVEDQEVAAFITKSLAITLKIRKKNSSPFCLGIVKRWSLESIHVFILFGCELFSESDVSEAEPSNLSIKPSDLFWLKLEAVDMAAKLPVYLVFSSARTQEKGKRKEVF